MKKYSRLLTLLVLLPALLCGCRAIRVKEEEKTPLDYTVVREEDIPKEIQSLLEEKKEKEFQLAYQSGEYLYLVKGYGRQSTGGYSIQVEELALGGEAVFFKTNLIGPSKDEEKGMEPSYPYIVVKLLYREEPVQFQ